MSHCYILKEENYEFIKGEAIHVLTKYGDRGKPISGFELAKKMGIALLPYSQLSEEDLKTCRDVSEDGFFCAKGELERIYYNDMDCSLERQNWTILHELGHIVLDHTGHGSREEAEANFFAKYIIAPPLIVYLLQLDSPDALCRTFLISKEAATYSFMYYQKWYAKFRATGKFTDYECKLLHWYDEKPDWASSVSYDMKGVMLYGSNKKIRLKTAATVTKRISCGIC